LVELVVLLVPEPEFGCGATVETVTGLCDTFGLVATTVKEPEDVLIPFAGAVRLRRNVMTECSVTVECTVTVECREAVAPTGIAGAVPNKREEADVLKGLTGAVGDAQDGLVISAKAAEQTKSSTLGPSKPKRSIA